MTPATVPQPDYGSTWRTAGAPNSAECCEADLAATRPGGDGEVYVVMPVMVDPCCGPRQARKTHSGEWLVASGAFVLAAAM
jgi:hypothetical protein